MKVIFLDIDGVLNVIPNGHDEYGGIFHEHFVEQLRILVEETGAYIVISSTWRMSGLSVMCDMWDKRKLPGKILAITPYHHDRQRGREIEEWLQNYNIDKYVIIDDDTDFTSNQQKFFVHTANRENEDDSVEGYGLTINARYEAIKILNNECI